METHVEACLDVSTSDGDINTGGFVLNKLSQFIPDRVLSEDLTRKTICIQGSVIGNENPALVIIEQSPFNEDTVNDFFSAGSVLKTELINDVYGRYDCIPDTKLRGIKTTFIHPASQEDIKKYESHPIRIRVETPKFYSDVVLPYISRFKNLQWVYDILDKTSNNKILYEDTDQVNGFVVIPHLSWYVEDVNECHLVAIVRRRDIKSLRDLTSDHLLMLKAINSNVTVTQYNVKVRDNFVQSIAKFLLIPISTVNFIEEKYGISSSRLVVFLKYHPSYYHLHVHFANMSSPDLDCATEKCHLLSEVINNIEFLSDYYQKANLSFVYNPLDSWIQE